MSLSSTPSPEFAADAESFSIPSTAVVTDLAEAGRQLAAATERVREAEAELDAAKAERKRLAHDVLPSLFDTANTDRIGLPDAELDVVIRPYYHASIGGEMSPEQQEAAYDHVEELGGGDLIATVVEVKLGRGQLEDAQILRDRLLESQVIPDAELSRLQQSVRASSLPETDKLRIVHILGVHTYVPKDGLVRLSRGIPWATLTSFLRDWFSRRDEALEDCREGQAPPPPFDKVPNLDLLGATVGRVAKIEARPRRRSRRS